METGKIAVACFIGGALCCAIALAVSPAYWWLGLLAGLAGGYLSYEFRDMCRAIPVAFRTAAQAGGNVLGGIVSDLKTEWRSKPCVFFYLSAVFCTPLAFWFYKLLVLKAPYQDGYEVMAATSCILLTMLVSLYAVVLGAAFIASIAFFGARHERVFWWPPLFFVDSNQAEALRSSLLEQGYREETATFGNVIRWFAKGMGCIAFFFVWTMWQQLAVACCEVVYVLLRSAWELFKLVHSHKRVLCALDGTLGGAASYLYLAPNAVTLSEKTALVFFGGLLGAALGVLNWEVVSKRLLHVQARRK